MAPTGIVRIAGLMIVFATSTSHGAETLTLERALSLADTGNPRIRAAAAQADAAAAGITTARAFPNPDVEASAGRQRGRGSPAAPEGPAAGIGLVQPLDLPYLREPRIRGAEANVDARRLAFAEVRQSVRAEVRQAFFTVLRRKAELELAIENQRLLEDIGKRVEVRVRVGEAPKLEATRSQAETSVAVNAASASRLRVQQALSSLRATIGTPLPADIDVLDDGIEPAMPPALELLREEVLARHPSIGQARAEARRAQARLESERALRYARPAIRTGLDRLPDSSVWTLGVAVPIPLWDQRQGPIAEAASAVREADAVVEQRRVELIGAIEAAYGRFQVANQTVGAYEGGILRQAEAALRVAESAYRFGERGFIDVLDAQRVLRSARIEYLGARFDRRSALIEIERLRQLFATEATP